MLPQIPKIIHFCWFGHTKKPDLVRKCLSSWKKYLHDYRLIEWNEYNFNFSNCLFACQAYKAKKYAFVADYVRACALYEYGGVYMDTDMEVLREFDSSLLKADAFLGCEKPGFVNGAIIGATTRSSWMRELKEYYETTPFIKDDGTLDLTPIPSILTALFKETGFTDSVDHQYLQGGIHIYPTDYFYPKSYLTNEIASTANTITIHHFAGSWVPLRERVTQQLKRLGVYDPLYPAIKNVLRFVKGTREKNGP
jgi:hypothetical protein